MFKITQENESTKTQVLCAYNKFYTYSLLGICRGHRRWNRMAIEIMLPRILHRRWRWCIFLFILVILMFMFFNYHVRRDLVSKKATDDLIFVHGVTAISNGTNQARMSSEKEPATRDIMRKDDCGLFHIVTTFVPFDNKDIRSCQKFDQRNQGQIRNSRLLTFLRLCVITICGYVVIVKFNLSVCLRVMELLLWYYLRILLAVIIENS